MKASLQRSLAGTALALFIAAPAWSASFMDGLNQAAQSAGAGQTQSSPGLGGLGGMGSMGGLGSLGGLGLPAIGSGATSNVAGILQYCVQNKYLGAAGAEGVKDQLLGKLGMSTPAAQQKDPGFQQGLGGLLQGSDGKSFNLSSLQDQVKEKACDYVLDNAKSLI